MQFYKTIRFKLTLWYSGLLFVVAAMFVLIINLAAAQILLSEPTLVGLPPQIVDRLPVRWVDIAEDQRALILELRENDLTDIRQVSILALIPITFFSFVGGYLISWYMLKPIDDINKATKKITASSIDMRIPSSGIDDELGELIDNFNLMLARLAESFELQQQFIESASHELKTPLAVIKTNLETVTTDPQANKQDLVQAIKIALQSVDNMNVLVEDLLLLSHQAVSMERQKVDIVELLEKLVADNKQLAEQHNVQLKFHSKLKNFVFEVNPFYFARGVNNVLENAIKYSKPEDAWVEIALEKRKRGFVLSINDNGLGMSDTVLEKIFDRFYRVDKSLSRKLGGSGLGLSIARKIVESHGGKIAVSSKLGEGSKFVLAFD